MKDASSTKYISNSLETTQKIAREFATEIQEDWKNARIVGLYGDLGAGKTAFVQGLAIGLGVTESVLSPTFVIERIYNVGLPARPFFHLIHIDAYRLEKSEELLNLGWKKIISNPSNLIVIEWPEKIADIMPEHIQVKLTALPEENSRRIEILTDPVV